MTPNSDGLDPVNLAAALSALSWRELDEVSQLADVELRDDVSESGKFAYLHSALKGLGQPELTRLFQALNDPRTQEDEASELRVSLFVSHSARQRTLAGDLRRELGRFEIDAFVAHDVIGFDEAWHEVIVNKLNSCHALLAVVTDDFATSSWCDQEVGWALGRGVPVMSINAGKAPYGFFGRRQALPYRDDPRDVAGQVATRLLKSERTGLLMTGAIVTALESVGTYDDASRLISILDGAEYWDASLIRRARRSIAHNDQVTYADHGSAKVRLRHKLDLVAAGSGQQGHRADEAS